MVDVIYSECCKLIAMLWNLHIIHVHAQCCQKHIRSGDGGRIMYMCSVHGHNTAVCGHFVTRAEVYHWYTIASVVCTC